MARHVPNQLKSIVTDTVWSIAGMVLMNAIVQLVLFPILNKTLGSEAYGNIIYLIAIMNVIAISVGSGVNYTRMRISANGASDNNVYLILMAGGSVIAFGVLLILRLFALFPLGTAEFLLFCFLTVITMWRYYADVEYRLHINYRGYFLFYLVIGIGYLVGILLFQATGLWQLALLPGEVFGLLLVFWKGSIFRKETVETNESAKKVTHLALMLVGANVLSHLVFNGDRLVLQWLAGGTAVTVYYLASLFGKTMTLITTPLNGVLVGHLAKYKGTLTSRLMSRVMVVVAAAITLATALCVATSLLLLPFLYPNDYETVKRYLLIANVAQVIYFIGNVLMASFLLRFTHERNQLIINVVHALLFAAVCIPLAWACGINGFCWALLIVNLARLALCFALGYLGVKKK